MRVGSAQFLGGPQCLRSKGPVRGLVVGSSNFVKTIGRPIAGTSIACTTPETSSVTEYRPARGRPPRAGLFYDPDKPVLGRHRMLGFLRLIFLVADISAEYRVLRIPLLVVVICCSALVLNSQRRRCRRPGRGQMADQSTRDYWISTASIAATKCRAPMARPAVARIRTTTAEPESTTSLAA